MQLAKSFGTMVQSIKDLAPHGRYQGCSLRLSCRGDMLRSVDEVAVAQNQGANGIARITETLHSYYLPMELGVGQVTLIQLRPFCPA